MNPFYLRETFVIATVFKVLSVHFVFNVHPRIMEFYVFFYILTVNIYLKNTKEIYFFFNILSIIFLKTSEMYVRLFFYILSSISFFK